jgi:hypothetical protein
MKSIFLFSVLQMAISFVMSQNYIRFSNVAITSKDLSGVSSRSSFSADEPIFFAFEIRDVEKMKLNEHEVLIIGFKFLDAGIQSIARYRVLATQDEQGVVRGSGVVLPIVEDQGSHQLYTVTDDFHNQFIQTLRSASSKKASMKIVVDEYDVNIYDALKKSLVLFEERSRFPQFIENIMGNFTLKKPVAFTLPLSKSFPFEETMTLANTLASQKETELYDKASGSTKAPTDFLSDNFKGFTGEIDRAQTQVLMNNFFEDTDYTLSKLSYFTNSISYYKDDLGIPDYKYFILGFYAKNANGKCAYGTVDMISRYLGDGNYSSWKTSNYKLTDCVCD